MGTEFVQLEDRPQIRHTVHMYVCLLFVNGLIQVMPKAVCMYMHHDRKPMCIAIPPYAD
jgi:hypothetical protein